MLDQLTYASLVCDNRPCRSHVDPSRRFRPALLTLAIATAFAAVPALAQTLPNGGMAVHGQASFSQPTPNQLVVTTQNGAGTGHSAINWQSFSISAGAGTRFVQPSATSLSINRVVTGTPSAIFGNLSSNGRLVLVNQSGIAIGAGAMVDTAGFTASSLRLSDADALAGRLRFGANNPGAGMGGGSGITVNGVVTARNADVVLVAPQITVGASALIQAPNGSTVLAAGQQVEITGRGLEGIRMLVQARENEALNLGQLQGSAVGIFAGTLRHSGAIQATTAALDGGKVVLKAAGDAVVQDAGTIEAIGEHGGSVDVLGRRVAVKGQASIDVSGRFGGGSIRIGGDFQGKNPDVPNAQRTYLGPDAVLRADALDNGDGGRVIVWADGQTKAYGTISARGGALGGNGGFAEVSGKQALVFDAQVDLRAPAGAIGTLLLDPQYITVDDGGEDLASDADEFTDVLDGAVSVSPRTLDEVGGNVMLQADGDISFVHALNLTTPGASLTALAGNLIHVGAAITTTGGDILLHSAHPGALGNGSTDNDRVQVDALITSNGGKIELRANSCDMFCDSIIINANINAGTGAIVLAGVGDVRQTGLGAMTGGSLAVTADSTIILNELGNNIPGTVDLFTNVTTEGASQINFRNSAAEFTLSRAVAKGPVNIDGTGALTTTGTIQSTTGNVTVNFVGGMAFGGNVSAFGSLGLSTIDNVISQSLTSGISAGGLATINAGSSDINLFSALNNFSTVALTGANLSVVDTNALNVTSRTQAADSNLYLEARGGALTVPLGAIDTGVGQLTLIDRSGPLTTPGALTGTTVLLKAQGNLTLAHPVTSNSATTMTLTSGGTLSVQAAVDGHGINMDATNGIDILAPVHASSGLTVTSTGANTLMEVRNAVTSDGTMDLSLTGGLSVVTNNLQSASLTASTGQTIAARYVEVLSSGGAVAAIHNLGSAQSITTSGVNDSGEGIRVADTAAGLGAGAQIASNGMTQTITVNDANFLRVLGAGGGSPARINHHGAGNQTIVVQGVTSQNRIELGTGAATAGSLIHSDTGGQSITAGQPGQSGGIMLAGGAVGQGVSIYTQANQTIHAGGSGIQLTGGGSSNNNYVGIDQQGATGTQTITSEGGITLNGGSTSGNSNYAQISASGSGGQSITMTGGNTLTIQGGAGGNDNRALVRAVNGAQSITGAPNISLIGGTAGANLLGNFASITAAGIQTIVANNLTLQAGLSGINNFAVLAAPTQNLTVQGDLTMTGGGSAKSLDDTIGGGVRIGGSLTGPSNVSLHVSNSITLTGGSVTGAGASIGSSRSSGQPATITITAGGDVTLNPGSDPVAGVRIGSTALAATAGNIDITAGSDFSQSGGTPGEASVKTLGNVNISAATTNIGNIIVGNTVRVVGASGVSINTNTGEAGSITATAPSGDSIKVESGGNFSNSSGPTALSIAGTGRWLVYSTDPAFDIRDGLAHVFRQFGSVPGDPVLGSGNGFIHSLDKDITVALNTTAVNKVYDGGTYAPLTAANYIVPARTGFIDVTVNLPTSGTFDNRNVGTGKTVSVSGITIASAMDTQEEVQVFGIGVTPSTLSGAIGTITPASITVSTSDISRPYNGTTSASGVPIATKGSLFGSDTLTGGSYAFSPNGNAGSGKSVSVSGVAVNDGNNGANYVLTLTDNNNSSITPAALTLSSSPVTKVYDTTTSAAGTLVVNSGSLIGGDTLSGGVFAFLDKNAGTGKAVTVGQAVINDGNGGQNYAITYVNNSSSTITKAGIAAVSGITAANKVYDGNADAKLNTTGAAFAGRLGADLLTVASANGGFADRNAGSDKPVAITGITLGGSDAANYTLMNPTSSTSANIGAAPLTISTNPVSKTFDGNTTAAGTAVVTAGSLVGGDTLSGGDFAFLDKNVGLNKTVTVANVGINDGNGGGNYAVTYVSNLTSSILSLGLSTWTGNADNRWTNPANWADGTVPDATNVLAVLIPAGAGNVLFDASAGTTNVQNLSSQRPFSVTGGSLLVGTDLSATDFGQSGGSVIGGGTMTVSGNFAQTGGNLNFAGIALTQTSGNLSFANLTAPSISLRAPSGMINQIGPVNAASLTTTSQAGTTLTNGGNRIGTLTANNTGGGDIRLINSGPLTISSMDNPSGGIFVTNTGAIVTIGPITAKTSDIHFTANSPLTIGAGGVSAGGNIVLTASNLTSAGNMTLNGPLNAGDSVSLTAGNNLVQNSTVLGARGVTASAGGTMTFGPLATTNNPPVNYSAAGIPVAAPPSTPGGQPGTPQETPRETPVTQAARETTDLVATFLERFQKALDAQQEESLSTDADGKKKQSDGAAIVTEEEICR